jgi:hypothetical protein
VSGVCKEEVGVVLNVEMRSECGGEGGIVG